MSLRLPYDQTSEKAFARDIAKAEARILLLEAHLRRVLEAGKHLRVCLDVVNFATYRLEATCRLEIANFDQAASDAEGVLSP